MSLEMERGPANVCPEGDANEISVKWEEWVEEFEAFADSRGLFNMSGGSDKAKHMRAQRKALLLYHAGARVREIVRSFATIDYDDYRTLVTKLKAHFTVEVNTTFQRHLFRKISQNEQESVAQFTSRLRKAAASCNFGDQIDDYIRDQIVECCKSDHFRRKLLEQGNDLTLASTLREAATFEAVELRQKEMSQTLGLNQEANRVYSSAPQGKSHTSGSSSRASRFQGNSDKVTVIKCSRCGRDKNHDFCPAMGKQCFKCKGKNHFRNMCRSNMNHVSVQDGPALTQSECSGQNDQLAFTLNVNACKLQRTDVMVGNIKTRFIIDSGADCNVIDLKTYEQMKTRNIKVNRSVKGGPKLFSYSAKTPIDVIGQFWANIESHTGKVSNDVRFIVVDAVAEPLLGLESATDLGILHVTNCASTKLDYNKLESMYTNLFSGKIGKAEGEIELTVDKSVPPVTQPFRVVPFALRTKLEAHIDELIEADIIEKVSGPVSWASPVVIVPKNDGKIRLCVDMRQANQAIVRHNYPVPTIDELLLNMNGSKVFSKIDLKSGFHQFVLAENSRDITTFNTHLGLYRYKRLMFGISSAPEIYQSMVADIIRGIPGVTNLADDIVIHGKTREEHDSRLVRALDCLEKSGMTLNERKCSFGASEINFVGHQVTDKGVNPGKDKVKAVLEAEEPINVGQMKSFLGLVGYCSKFIPDFSSKTECLRRLTLGMKPADKITLDSEEKLAFKRLKDDLASADTLAYFDIDAETSLYTDASPVGLGLVLTQRQNGQERVVCYASRTLTKVERRYCQTEEALSIVWACERLHHYLFGVKFTLLTDHQALETIYGKAKKVTSARIERWVLRLQSYDFNVKYIKGSHNIADSLSRLMSGSLGGESSDQMGAGSSEEVEMYVRNVVLNAVVYLEAITAREIEGASNVDGELSCLMEAISNSDFGSVSRVYKAIKDELCIFGRLVMRGNRIVIPVGLRQQMITLAHEGHLGIVGTKKNLRSRVWWPGMDTDVEKFVKRCHGCQVTGGTAEREPVRVTELPNGPWEDLAVDILGPLPNGESILVVVDYYSRWYEIRILTSTVASKVIKAMQSMFDIHGLPISIKSDNGPQFVAHEFKEYLGSLGIHHHLVTPRWPEANGEVERQNRSLMKRVRIAYSEGKDYKHELNKYIVSYRNVAHSITGKSPAEMLFGRKLRVKIPQSRDIFNDIEVRDRDSELKHTMVESRNQGLGSHTHKVGDLVLVKRDCTGKVDTPFHTAPFRVKEVSGTMITVESEQGRVIRRNSSFVKPYLLPNDHVVGVGDQEKPISRCQYKQGRQTTEVTCSQETDDANNLDVSHGGLFTEVVPGGKPHTAKSQQKGGEEIGTDSVRNNVGTDSVRNNVPSRPPNSRQRKAPTRYGDYDSR